MCIIVVKPSGKDMPKRKVLKHCWDNNDDGAGYMFPNGKEVIIKKGFMTFDRFYSNLIQDYKKASAFTPFVLHFRISTQGGICEECTHPFPLSREMEDLRKTKTTCEIGIAHNGVISLTKSGWQVKVTYSDTMKFITDYASLIIKGKDFYKDKDTVDLIDKLVGGRLAILDNDGHIQLIGDFKEKDGIYYSNNTFEEDRESVKKAKEKEKEKEKEKAKEPETKQLGSKWTPIDYSGCNCNCDTCKGHGCCSTKDVEPKYIDAFNRPKVDNTPPSLVDLYKMDKVTRAIYLDRYYSTREVEPFKYDFKQDNCPMFYEGETGFCYMCQNRDGCCYLKHKGDKKDELEY